MWRTVYCTIGVRSLAKKSIGVASTINSVRGCSVIYYEICCNARNDYNYDYDDDEPKGREGIQLSVKLFMHFRFENET